MVNRVFVEKRKELALEAAALLAELRGLVGISGLTDLRLFNRYDAEGMAPELYREAIVWGYLSDLSGSEAAARLGCSENTLYQRVFKAKQKLKKAMSTEVA